MAVAATATVVAVASADSTIVAMGEGVTGTAVGDNACRVGELAGGRVSVGVAAGGRGVFSSSGRTAVGIGVSIGIGSTLGKGDDSGEGIEVRARSDESPQLTNKKAQIRGVAAANMPGRISGAEGLPPLERARAKTWICWPRFLIDGLPSGLWQRLC